MQRENDSLFMELQLQIEQMDQLYQRADLLQNKLLNNQVELIRTEESLNDYQVRYSEYLEATDPDVEKQIRYRTRYIFRDKQEKKWFWITWGIFLAVPTCIIALTR